MKPYYLLVSVAASFMGVLSLPSPAWASDEAAAQALFTSGREAMKAGNYAKACPMLEESFRLVPGDGTRFNLADCYEKTGRTASAWAAFRDVAASSKLAGQHERESAASARAAALENTLCKLTVEVAPQHATPITVFRDGTEVRKGQWGVPIPVDAGEHVVEARRGEVKLWDARVTSGACPSTLNVVVPEVSAAPHSPPPNPEKPATAAPTRASWRVPVIVTSLALGTVATGVGSYFGIRAWTLRNDSNEGHCTGNTCDDIGRSLRDDSRSAGTVSTITFIAGGALLAVGVILWLTDSKSP